jgi:hypothetical protein
MFPCNKVPQIALGRADRTLLRHTGEPLFARLIDAFKGVQIEDYRSRPERRPGGAPAPIEIADLGFRQFADKLQATSRYCVMNVVAEARCTREATNSLRHNRLRREWLNRLFARTFVHIKLFGSIWLGLRSRFIVGG